MDCDQLFASMSFRMPCWFTSTASVASLGVENKEACFSLERGFFKEAPSIKNFHQKISPRNLKIKLKGKAFCDSLCNRTSVTEEF